MNQRKVNKNGQPQTSELMSNDSSNGKKAMTIKVIAGTTTDRIRYEEATRNARFIE